MNPQNGLKIRPFRDAHFNRAIDQELVGLTNYLKEIAKLDDLSLLNHRRWERYLLKKSLRPTSDAARSSSGANTQGSS